MPPRLILILICLTAVIRGTELVEVVWELKIPSLATAKIVLEKLDRLIENGDARTVTLGKKVQRSVKRIFTKEHKVLAGKKDADDREAEARQLDRNRKQWLKPNVFGNVPALRSPDIAFGHRVDNEGGNELTGVADGNGVGSNAAGEQTHCLEAW